MSVFYPLTQVGKRRGGVFLKTGMVAKKQKQDAEVSMAAATWLSLHDILFFLKLNLRIMEIENAAAFV